MNRETLIKASTAGLFILLAAEFVLFRVKSGSFSLNMTSAEASLGIIIVLPFFFLSKLRSYINSNRSLIIITGLMFFTLLVSSVFSPLGIKVTYKYLIRYFAMILGAWHAVYLFHIYPSLKKYFFSLVFFTGLTLSVIALIESFSPQFSDLLSNIFREGEAVFINGKARPAATLTHANIFSCFMGISVIAGAQLLYKKGLKGSLFFPAAAVMITGMVLSSSRNSMLALFISIIILMLNKNTLKSAVILAVLFTCSYFLFSPSLKRIADVKSRSAVNRIILWKSAYLMFKDYPAFGAGPGAYGKLLINYAPEDFIKQEEKYVKAGAFTAHNGFFNILAEFGITGILIVTGGIALILFGFIRNYSLMPPDPKYAYAASLIMPFAADAFFYSYFYMTLVIVSLLLLYKGEIND